MRKLFLILMAVVACAWSAMAQNRTISGIVIDAANNEPLIGATVMPNGGGQGTATDIDGNFTLSVPANVKTATVSYVGYKSQTVDLKDGMTVHLASESTTLDDVVVVAYGTATKESLTGSVAVVGAKEIEDRPVTSATAALEGNAPGVQVNSTVGQPGTDPSIRIRGFNSINGSMAPIYVVDGVPYSGSIADINPADIESMSVLKDAASAALYGAKGANGVILITTKRAKKVGKVDVTLTVREGIYNRGVPEYDKLAANQWMETMFQGAVNGNVTLGTYPTYQENFDYVRRNFINGYARNNIYGVAEDQLFDANGKLTVANPLPGYTDLDWWDAVSRNGFRQEYNVNAAAASEKYNLFASVGYLKEQGYLLKTDFERFSGRVNANFNPTSYFKFGINLSASSQDSETGQFTDTGLAINPFLTMFQAPIYPYYAHNEDGSIQYVDGEPVWNTKASYLSNRNVAYELRKNFSSYKNNVIDASIYGTAIIPYGFELTVRGNMNRTKTDYTDYSNKEVGDAAPYGSISKEFDNIQYHTFMQTLTWSHYYGANNEHFVDVLLNHENYQYSVDYSYIVNQNEDIPGRYGLSNFAQNMATQGGLSGEERTESYLGRVRYNYNEKYYGEASFRRDGSSRFHPDYRWGNFWSVGGSWVISKERFMQNLDWVNYLKLRAAYGTVGNNAAAGAYSYWSLYGVQTYSQTNYYYRAQLAAEDLQWESTNTFDVALEGTLFNNRLNFSVGYFDKRNADLIFAVTIPKSAGSTIWSGANQSISKNIGTMSNRGWEISFNGTILRNKDVNWTANIDATFLKNKIVALPEGKDINAWPYCYSEGRSVYEFYTYEWAGVDQLTGQSLYLMNPDHKDYQTVNAEGQTVFNKDLWNQTVADAEKDGKYVYYNGKHYTTDTSYATREWQGSALPTVYGSFGTNFSWKGLGIGVLFTYSLGGQTMDGNYASLMSASGATSALHVDALNSWVAAPEGMTADSPNRIDPNGIPQMNFQNSMYNNASGTSRWLVDSSWLVFKNLLVSYDLPQKWVQPLQLQNINIAFSADNLFTVSARKGMNPSSSFSGGQSASFVTPRVFSFQLTAKF